MLVVVMVFGVGVASLPGMRSDRAAPAEVLGIVVVPEETPRAEPVHPLVPPDNDLPRWLLPGLVAVLVFFGVTGVAAAMERNPPARFGDPRASGVRGPRTPRGRH